MRRHIRFDPRGLLFTADGNGCPVGQINAPFFTFTTAGSPQRLFGEAATGGFNPVLFPSAVVLVGQPSGAFIEGSLAHGDTVGILVQRILGTKRVHGQVVLVLQTVGKVPLGHHNQGRLKIKWNLKVNGHRLKPGRYLITLRAFDSVHHLLGTAKPVIFRIK